MTHAMTHSHVLQLDIQGTPQAWISLEQAATHMAAGALAWTLGNGPLATLRGGFHVARGRQSLIEVHPIIALHGASPILPYVPSRFEDFLLEGRPIRADVHEWLAARLPKESRLS